MRRVLVCAGDGIGPAVVAASLHVLEGLGLDLDLIEEPVGMAGYAARGAAITDDNLGTIGREGWPAHRFQREEQVACFRIPHPAAAGDDK